MEKKIYGMGFRYTQSQKDFMDRTILKWNTDPVEKFHDWNKNSFLALALNMLQNQMENKVEQENDEHD